MRFGLIYELQLPRPWDADSEHRLVQQALTEVEVADHLGFDYVWANEHHFLEEYSHNSAPEVFLAAAAGRTRQIHVGHGVVLSPPGYNPPAHVAERIAMLDLVSSGRAEWGTGSSASRAELEGFNVDAAQKKLMWAEATEQSANMMAMTPYPGYRGEFFSMPARTRRRSTSPRVTGWARSPSPSSIPTRHRNGPASTTRSSSPMNACRSAMR
jgi:alkanesulfonate monooxygenase SsuD/methylene tetrahydromethanopterin reductase-like flavin-dependent oxidoreductase (luciferase family)